MKINYREFIWFGVALFLAFFIDGRWRIPLAAWLAPIFWIRFMRSQKPLPGIIWLFVGTFLASFFSMQGIIPQDLVSYLVTVLMMVVVDILPYLADRLMAPQINGFASTLVFPTVFVSLEYLNSLTSPFGTWGALAYTQVDNLPLIQLVSITGIWGISFLITWFASSANWVWEQNF